MNTTMIWPQSIRPPRLQAPIGKRDGADQRIDVFKSDNRKSRGAVLPDTIGGTSDRPFQMPMSTEQFARCQIGKGSNPEPSCSPHLPRYRSTLHDARNLAAELAVDHWPPWDKSELVALFDNGELAAR